jgi:hypothetical protein
VLLMRQLTRFLEKTVRYMYGCLHTYNHIMLYGSMSNKFRECFGFRYPHLVFLLDNNKMITMNAPIHRRYGIRREGITLECWSNGFFSLLQFSIIPVC